MYKAVVDDEDPTTHKNHHTPNKPKTQTTYHNPANINDSPATTNRHHRPIIHRRELKQHHREHIL
jgi:hypothetical protein